jgi:GPH family glycoside/pentoside/hexuronide:cation symporter
MMVAYWGTINSAASIVSMPIVIWCGTHLGKRRTLLLGQGMIILGSALSWFMFNPNHPYLQFALAFFLAPAYLSVWVLLSAMLADVTDVDELELV